MPGFHCRSCGEYHDDLPLAFGPDAPDSWAGTPVGDRSADSVLTSDQCILDHELFFIRGCLDLPILDSEQVFRWLVWISVSEPAFRQMNERWEQPGREEDPPCFGWLNTRLPGYPDTFNLKVNVHVRPVGEQPFVEVEHTGHPIAVEQREGIPWHRVQERVEQLLHGTAAA
jgi:hypothetical protein